MGFFISELLPASSIVEDFSKANEVRKMFYARDARLLLSRDKFAFLFFPFF